MIDDKQFVFYNLNLMIKSYFQADEIRQTLKGVFTFKEWVIETLTDSPQFNIFMAASSIKEIEFWDVFFRHNNFFIEKNIILFPEIKNKDEVRADSLTNMTKIWVACKVGEVEDLLHKINDLKKKYKLYREVPEYALQQAEEYLCPVLDAKCKREPITILSPEMWFPVLDYLDLHDQMNLAKTCRSLYSDIRNKVIGKVLVIHPDLKGITPLRKILWLALVPKVE
jgi:hypothetical protein